MKQTRWIKRCRWVTTNNNPSQDYTLPQHALVLPFLFLSLPLLLLSPLLFLFRPSPFFVSPFVVLRVIRDPGIPSIRQPSTGRPLNFIIWQRGRLRAPWLLYQKEVSWCLKLSRVTATYDSTPVNICKAFSRLFKTTNWKLITYFWPKIPNTSEE